jgi:hypothetical protein
MFASMFAELAQRAPGSRLLCDPRLAALFARSFPLLEVIGEGRNTQRARVAALSGLRCKIAAGSLGALFRRTAADFPRHRGYLMADPGKVAAWRAQLERLKGARKVGLSWLGGVQKTGRSHRSIPLRELSSLLGLPDVAWASLQYTDATEEIAMLREQERITIHDFREATQDMDELAGLVQALDAVVSVCNTTVHVAGALGKQVLVMAPLVPEWRYGMSGEMLWYPSARIFRQARYGDWNDVVAKVRNALSYESEGEVPTRTL